MHLYMHIYAMTENIIRETINSYELWIEISDYCPIPYHEAGSPVPTQIEEPIIQIKALKPNCILSFALNSTLIFT